MADNDKKDICLTPETFVFLQNEAKNGMISVFVGPCLVNQTGQDKPVIYDPATRRYRQVSTLEAAVQYFCRAEEGDYVILENPAEKETFPTESVQQTVPLQRGRKIVVPGPWSKPLWPGQSARVVPGHRLRSNQYLIVSIYNEEEAKKNWSRAIAKPASTTTDTEGKSTVVETPTTKEFAVGQRFIIKGTDYSFYIPPTGVEVEQDEEGNYVRSAVTLEQLEYTILVDESGKKRYPQGPDVVFPEPNEQFVTNADGKRKFRAIELIAGSGILVKVIQPYTENGTSYAEGQEVFITAEETPIYRPREEHSVINYDGQNAIHFSTCVPKGEGRYVMNKMTGDIKLVHGPCMLLPDPRTEVMVRRVLTSDQCNLWYPGNQAALQYNEGLRQAQSTSGGTRSGFVSESAYQTLAQNAASLADVSATAHAAKSFAVAVPLPTREAAGSAFMEKFVRPSQYTPPRQITLDTRFDGVPSIKLYTGYAAMVVDKNGNRRVEVGPTNILLEYDESLEILELSRGKPKTTDDLLRTVYLRVTNNKISDIVDIETADHVTCQIKFSYCVNFEGEANEWFEVENYVKYLCDHARSVMKGMAKRYTVEELYQNYLNIIRDCILGIKPDGAKRTGMFFPENGMRVTDVEVLGFYLTNQEIAKMLAASQQSVVQQNIEIAKAEKALETLKKNEEIKVHTAEARAATKQREQELQKEDIERALEVSLANINAAVKIADETLTQEQKTQAIEWFKVQESLKRSKAQTDQQQAVEEAKTLLKLKTLDAETQAVVNRIVAAKDGFSEALVALGRDEVLVKVAEASRIEGFISGDSTEATIGRIVGGLPIFQGIMERMSLGNGNKMGGRLAQGQSTTK